MKAKIKKTGEIVNIADYARVTLNSCDSYGNPLELGFDEVEILQEKSDNIDWEQIRIKAAISALQGFAANSDTLYSQASSKELAIWSVCAANELITELKEGDRDD